MFPARLIGSCNMMLFACVGSLIAIALLSPIVTADCPSSCMCVLANQMLCEQAGLNSLPEKLPLQTEILALRKNNIKSIPPDAFRHLPKLKRLNLDGNQIVDIAPYAFRGLKNMEEISLQNNPLPFLATNSFANLFNVTNIYLGYNKISSIAMNAFVNTANVQSLSLIGNPLKTIESGAFGGLHNVDILYLPTGIEEIEADAFNGLSRVNMLRLMSMNVEQLAQYTFRSLSNVSALSIRDSNISVIKSRTFYGLSGVDYLTIENCTVERLEANALQGVHGIEVLSFHRNRIHNLEPGALDQLTGHVNKVRFSTNWFPCDCRLRWVAESHKVVVPTILNDNMCLSPDDAFNKTAASINLQTLASCEPDGHHLPPFVPEHEIPEDEEDSSAPAEEHGGRPEKEVESVIVPGAIEPEVVDPSPELQPSSDTVSMGASSAYPCLELSEGLLLAAAFLAALLQGQTS